jgi:hypothetical protein
VPARVLLQAKKTRGVYSPDMWLADDNPFGLSTAVLTQARPAKDRCLKL